ncbi:TPA: DUF2591 domain-containing protein [Burkholderia vietnamiensis]|nr:DUF2591 domain-containing protein [Burkholderia vietnamiensis]
MKVATLLGARLDYWVAKAEGHTLSPEWDSASDGGILIGTGAGDLQCFAPSTDWADGGPIIQRALISVLHGPINDPDGVDYWTGFIRPSDDDGYDGETPLIAGMRAYVASKFGAEVPGESI